MKLIKNVQVYTPEPIGKKDIFIAGGKIVAIEDHIDAHITGVAIDVIDGSGKIATPGFIDSHFHFLGGGGENGFQNRTPEVQLTDLTTAGVTTTCGLLGTDGYARNDRDLVAKAKALRIQGITTYVYIGNYRLPIEPLTGSIIGDIMMIEECIGVGEIAISDHRNNAFTFEEFVKTVADSRVGGLLSGKSGLANIHVGPGPSRLDYLFRMARETDIPITNVLPTHIGRSQALVDEGFEFVKLGGYIDVTASECPQLNFDRDGELSFGRIMKQALEQGINTDHITLSSDGQGSLPRFDAQGQFIEMGVASAHSLLSSIKDAIEHEGIDLVSCLKSVTSNVATICGFKEKGHLAIGMDADILLIDPTTYSIADVIAMGQTMVKNGDPIVFGDFERH